MLNSSIYDSVMQLKKEIEDRHPRFNSRESLNLYVGRLFHQSIVPFVTAQYQSKMSQLFYNGALKPHVEILECFLKNYFIKYSGKENEWKEFYADTIFLNPNYKFWCMSLLEHGYFMEYIFHVINNSEANDLRKYINNIEKTYSTKGDTLLTKIAISQGLISFSEKFTSINTDTSIPIILDSICKANNLYIGKYNFPNFTLSESKKLEIDLFDKIILAPFENNNELKLKDVIHDTSKVYYIDYWASWCNPCIKGVPYTINLYEKNNSKLKVLFFSIDKARENFLNAVTKLKLPISQTFNVINEDAQALNSYKKLNPIEQIPVYQIIFFFEGSWRTMNAFSSEDNLVNKQINNIIQSLGIGGT